MICADLTTDAQRAMKIGFPNVYSEDCQRHHNLHFAVDSTNLTMRAELNGAPMIPSGSSHRSTSYARAPIFDTGSRPKDGAVSPSDLHVLHVQLPPTRLLEDIRTAEP